MCTVLVPKIILLTISKAFEYLGKNDKKKIEIGQIILGHDVFLTLEMRLWLEKHSH